MAGQIALATHELFAAAHGFVEGQVLQAVQRVVVDECPHRPVLREDFARPLDDVAQVSPRGVDLQAG